VQPEGEQFVDDYSEELKDKTEYQVRSSIARIEAEQAKRERLLGDDAELAAYAADKGISVAEMSELLYTNYQNNSLRLDAFREAHSKMERLKPTGINFKNVESLSESDAILGRSSPTANPSIGPTPKPLKKPAVEEINAALQPEGVPVVQENKQAEITPQRETSIEESAPNIIGARSYINPFPEGPVQQFESAPVEGETPKRPGPRMPLKRQKNRAPLLPETEPIKEFDALPESTIERAQTELADEAPDTESMQVRGVDSYYLEQGKKSVTKPAGNSSIARRAVSELHNLRVNEAKERVKQTLSNQLPAQSRAVSASLLRQADPADVALSQSAITEPEYQADGSFKIGESVYKVEQDGNDFRVVPATGFDSQYDVTMEYDKGAYKTRIDNYAGQAGET
jgi:hypothetical protein